MESGKSKSFCAVRATKFAGPADPNPEPKPGLHPYRKNPSVATLCGEKSADPCRWQRGARQRRPEAKGKGTKTSWARRDVYWENMWHDLLSVIFCKLSLDGNSSVSWYSSSHAPWSFHNPPPDTLAYQRQHIAPSTLLAKYKVPQPNALRLSHIAMIWLNLFPSAFPALLLSVTLYIHVYIRGWSEDSRGSENRWNLSMKQYPLHPHMFAAF